MPVLYGEGYPSAFYRLQVEIFQTTGDQTILAWRHRVPDITRYVATYVSLEAYSPEKSH